jgi:hypothetical protein
MSSPERLTAQPEFTLALDPADVLYIVDVSDTTDNAGGSGFKMKPGKFSLPATVQTGTTYTIDANDDNTIVELSNAAAVTVTIPTDASDDLRDGYTVTLFSSGAGGVTLSTTGVTLKGSSPNTTIAQNEIMVLQKSTTANTWYVMGATAA